MKIVKLRITLGGGRFKYIAEAIEGSGRYYYRVGGTTIEVIKSEYDYVIANPHLYYFSTALKLHYAIEKGLRKNVQLSSESYDKIAEQEKSHGRAYLKVCSVRSHKKEPT
jgi:hypothetical protein